jgi:hypothetical protein
VLDDKGITVESCKDLKVKTSADTAYDIGGKGEFKTSTDFKVDAGAQLQLSGSAGAALQSSATVKVAGSLVQIN